MIKRFNQTIENMLSLWVDQSQTDWDEHLALLMMAYRSSKHETTKETPNAMMLGREVSMPVDLLVGTGRATVNTAYAQKLQDRLRLAHEVARDTVGAQMRQQKKHYDQATVVRLLCKAKKKGRSPKLRLTWTGPYVIIAMLSDVVYCIKRSPLARPQVVHAGQI